MMPGIDASTAGPAGNVYPKYESRNPVARFLVARYLQVFRDLVRRSGARRALEVGCGEGYLAEVLANEGITVHATDVSAEIICIAEKRSRGKEGRITFDPRGLEDLDCEVDSAPLVVCCEVLEHLDAPDAALARLVALARPHLVVSVPREPLWRVLNIARGKYLSDLGNTPGHLQHWSCNDFLALLRRHVEIVEVRTPLPWTFALCRAPVCRQ